MKATIFTNEQIFGAFGGVGTQPTDMSVLLGGANGVGELGDGRIMGRPVLKLSASEMRALTNDIVPGNPPVVKFGGFPQSVFTDQNLVADLAENMPEYFKSGYIQDPRKKCSIYIQPRFEGHRPDFVTYPVYSVAGRYFIEFFGVPRDAPRVANGPYKGVYFVEVEPIEWIVDTKNNLLIAKHVLISVDKLDENYIDKYFYPQMRRLDSLMRPKKTSSFKKAAGKVLHRIKDNVAVKKNSYER